MATESSEIQATLRFLEDTPRKISEFIADLTGAELRWKPAADEFSLLENVCHLRDLEREGYLVRIKRILSESNPSLVDFDGARIAAERNYQAEDPSEALAEFVSVRMDNVQQLLAARTEQLEQSGKLEGVGTITLARLAEMMREHDEGHLDEIRVLRARLR